MRRLALVFFCLAALPAAAQNTNDPRDARTSGKTDYEIREEERNFREGEVKFPQAPKPERLIEFFPSATTNFRFFIDSDSLTVGGDGVVRYTLIARSASGYENITYEGIRCRANQVRVYGYGDGGKWSRSSADWQPIEGKSVQRWPNELRNRYFCPLGLSIMTAEEGKGALRAGGHPSVPMNSDLRRN